MPSLAVVNGSASGLKDDTTQRDEALLASLGYKQELRRTFKPFELFGLAFSIIGLLPSMASVLFFAIPNGGGPAMVWGWMVASLFVVLIGIAIAELASAAPTSGGLYFWTHSLSSPRWKNVLCWTVGYSNTLGNISGVAGINWGCSVQIMAAASIGSNGTFTATPAQLFGLYAAITVSHAVICCFGTTLLARLQNLYIVLNILLCLAIIIGLPAATPTEFRNPAKTALWDFSNLHGYPNGFAFILSFMAPLWTIGGFDSAVHISEEASNAAIAVPWAIVSAIAISGILGWAINMSLAFCMGRDLLSLVNSDQPMAAIFFNSFGHKTTLVIWSFVVIVQYMMGTSMLLSASRQTFAFSRDSALPFSKWLYRVNGYTKAPVNTVLFAAGSAIALGLLAFAGSQATNALFSLGVIALYYAFTVPICARFLGKNNFKPGPFYCGILSVPISVTAIIFMTFMIIVFLFPTTPQTNVGEMNYAVAFFGGVMVLCLIYYYFPVFGGINWFTGPRANVGSLPDSGSTGSFDEEKKGGTMQTVEVINS
ncbi:putative amino-acid permease C11D3.08c [Psilocybe cubensis]|uniref:Amino acid transporter n=2 Tax=Psilocybe cubensis TaxID=181762 RepID=A0A8H7XPE9_PSICU|nr:putative amino-acid permease C11D3.08c [Psilocybe cubensis]KAH9477067.1 putative amino-acid permease C11D3.08c [Psilocybe cubensis]